MGLHLNAISATDTASAGALIIATCTVAPNDGEGN